MKSPNQQLRLQVYLSRSGVCSRRRAMELIQAGKATVNGQRVTEPSIPVTPGRDNITLNGRAVIVDKYEYVLLNKPSGCVTTKARHKGEKTVIDLLPKELKHLHPVGRLDKDTEGLLLLTNDGELTHVMTHPRFKVEKTYFVRIGGQLSVQQRRKLERGIVLDGKKTAPAKVKDIRRVKEACEFLMTIHEGRKRQIRLMLAKVGHAVIYLKRTRQGPLTLENLDTGRFRHLTGDEISRLEKKVSGLSK